MVASATSFLIGGYVTGDVNFEMAIGAFDVVIKIELFYLHERAWYHSSFRVVHDEHGKPIKRD
ncbi:MAG: DUF2061 domain-containing protein [Prolixibacteraceae bacterium]|nr:DUF2061 domain-containing protein [Prolixibacteraceae bacterium]